MVRLTPAGLVLAVGIISLSLISFAFFSTRGFSFEWQQFVASLPSLIAIVAGTIILWKREFRKRALASVVLLIGASSGIAAILLALAASEPGATFPHDLTTGPNHAYEKVIKVAGLSGTRICRCAPTNTARVTLPGGFETQVSIYDRESKTPRIGLVIVHGNVWMGDNLSTYRMIASGLAKRGFVVATFDAPGFGDADSPFRHGPGGVADAYDRVAQIGAVVDYLISNTNVDPDKIAVFGHSGGVTWALHAADTNPQVSRVAIMIAPPPPTFANVSSSDPAYESRRTEYFTGRNAEQYRYVYGEDIPEWSTWELTERGTRYPGDSWDPYREAGHKPLLLILGERDEPRGHSEFLRNFDLVQDPKQVVMLRRSDHYANTAQTLGTVIYDAEVSRQLVDSLADWLNSDY